MSMGTTTPTNTRGAKLSNDIARRGDCGDWQTSCEFAKSVCQYLKDRGLRPMSL